MSRVKGRNTKPEIAVRVILHAMGFRFRLHAKKLPGNPDVVLPRHKKAIFVNGCLWHGHTECKRSKLPSSNVEFWQNKISSNMERDIRNIQALKDLGWNVLVVWACETRKKEILEDILKRFMGYGEATQSE